MTGNHLLLYRIAELMLEHEQHNLPVDLLFDDEKIGEFVKSIQIDSPYQQMLIEGVLTESVREEKLYVSFTVEGYFHYVLGEVICTKSKGLGAEILKQIIKENKLTGTKEGVEQCLIRDIQNDDLSRLILLIDYGGEMIEISSTPLAYAFNRINTNSKSNTVTKDEYHNNVKFILTLLLNQPTNNDIEVLIKSLEIIESTQRNVLLGVLLQNINEYIIPDSEPKALLFSRTIEFIDKSKQRHSLEYLIKESKKFIKNKNAEFLFLIGQQYKNLSDYENSILYFEQALDAATVSSSNAYLLHKINNSLGTALREYGDYNSARSYYEESLKIGIDFFGENHALTSYSYNNLGVIWSELGDFNKSIEYFKISLEIEKRINGEQHPMTSIRYNNLGVLNNEIRETKKALDYQTKGLNINKRLFGENHLSTCRSYINIGEIYMDLNLFNEAELNFRKGLTGYTITYGEWHPTVAEAQYYMGLLYVKKNQLDSAVECFNISLSIFADIFNESHPSVARAKHCLGDVYLRYKKLNIAKKYFSEAIITYRNILGKEHPKIKLIQEKINAINDR